MPDDPVIQVDPNKVIEAMQKRFAAQVTNYETQIAMMEVVIEDLKEQLNKAREL